MSEYTTEDMFLVYEMDDALISQPWTDIEQSGTLIHPETGEDLPLVGWSRVELSRSEQKEERK